MLRLNTTQASETSTVWQPTDDVYLQVSGSSDAVIDVQGRVHTDAPWASLDLIEKRATDIIRFARIPYMRVVVSKNPVGSQLRVWDSV